MCKVVLALTFSLVCFSLILTGCGSSNPALSPTAGDFHTDVSVEERETGRYTWGTWDLTIDLESMISSILPIRESSAHHIITEMLLPPNCNDCIETAVLEFNPVEKYIKFTISIRNPTGLTAYDVRGILKEESEEFRIVNADSYVRWQSDIHPFKAYAVDIPQRRFGPGETHVREFEVEYTTLGPVLVTQLRVDVSWPGNCREPYEIRNPQTSGEFFDYGKNDISCEMMVWDPEKEGCYTLIDLECLGMKFYTYSGTEHHMYPQEDDTVSVKDAYWHAGGFPPGTYRALITASKVEDVGENWPEVYNYVDITIDATPPSTGWALVWQTDEVRFGYVMDIDAEDNLYVGGGNLNDLALRRLNSNGEVIWEVVWVGGESQSVIRAIEVDPLGDVYVLGFFSGTRDFDPGPGIDEHTAQYPLPYRSLFLNKLSSEGDYFWSRTWGYLDAWQAYTSDLCSDELGNILVTSPVSGGDLDPGPGELIPDYQGDGDAVLSKFTPDGNLIWANLWGGEEFDAGTAVAVYEDWLCVTGCIMDVVDMDPGEGIDLQGVPGWTHVFLSRFDLEGQFLWSRTWGHFWNSASGTDVVIQSPASIYVTGIHEGYYEDFDPGPGKDFQASSGDENVFHLAKYDYRGNYLWARVLGGDDMHYSSLHTASKPKVVVDSVGNPYISSWISGAVDGDIDPDIYDYHNNNGDACFILKFSPAGDQQWLRLWARNVEWPGYGLGIDSQDNLYVCGGVDYGDSADFLIDFNPGPWLNEIAGEPAYNAFTCRMDSDGFW